MKISDTQQLDRFRWDEIFQVPIGWFLTGGSFFLGVPLSHVPLHWKPSRGCTSPTGARIAVEPPTAPPGTGSAAVARTSAGTKETSKNKEACTRSVYTLIPGSPQSRVFMWHKTMRRVRVAMERGQDPKPTRILNIYT